MPVKKEYLSEKAISDFALKKQRGKDFKILQLTDIQIIDPSLQPYEGRLDAECAERWADRNECALDLARALIKETKPDYVVLTGDNVYGQFDGDGSNFIALVNFMESFRLPWSFVNGNHDGEYEIAGENGERILCGKGMEWQGEYVKNHASHCLYALGDRKEGYGNYTVTLEEEGNIVYSFSFMDTHGCEGYEAPGVNEAQTDGYLKEMNKIKEYSGRSVPNFIFLHIPTKEFSAAMRACGVDGDVGVITEDGYPDKNGNYGRNGEGVSWFDSAALWSAIKKAGCTKGIFAGHDHKNNSSIAYEGIRFTFGTKTGVFDYCDERQQGGTLITVKDNGDFSVEPIYKNGLSEYRRS